METVEPQTKLFLRKAVLSGRPARGPTCCRSLCTAHISTCRRGRTREAARGGSPAPNQMQAPVSPYKRRVRFSSVKVRCFFLLSSSVRVFPPLLRLFARDSGATRFYPETLDGRYRQTASGKKKKMRLIHNMTTIAECPAPETSVPNRVIKMAVIGGSGVGKTGKKTTGVLEL